MAERKIGIKIADGTFYPILDEGAGTKKRLVLTTASREQENVQIDLYRGSEKDLSDAAYVGSLMVEHVSRDAEGETEIEMVVGIDEDGNLETTAEDKTGGTKQSLSVSLENLDEAALYEVPDFNIEDEDLTGELVEDIDWDTEQEAEEASGELSLGEEEDFGLDLESETPGQEESSEDEELSLEEEDFGFDLESGDLDLEGEELDLESGDLDLEGEELDLESETPGLEELSESEDAFGEEEDFGGDEEQYDSEEAAFGGEESEEPYESEEQPEEEAPSKGRPILVGILVILALALIGALLYLFVFMSQTDEEVPPLEAERAPVEEPAEEEPEEGLAQDEPEGQEPEESGQEAEVPQSSETPSITEEETETGTQAEAEAPVASVPGEWDNWEEGVWYRIRWGDTLWGISRSFYDTPWAYDEIADQNRIQNPDRIFAEEKIFIPKPD